MGRIKWYKRSPEDAIEGMRELTLEERGAYNTVLDLIYLRDGNLPDDDRFIAGFLGVDTRVWKRIRQRLIDAGKLYVTAGRLGNQRADSEVATALRTIVRNEDAGRASGRIRAAKSNKNKDQGGTDAQRGVRENKNKRYVSPSGDTPSGDDFDPKKIIFDQGRALLRAAGNRSERDIGTIIGRWVKDHPEDRIIAALVRAHALDPPPAEPVSWMHASLKERPNVPARHRHNDDQPTNVYVQAAIEREAERAAALGGEPGGWPDYGR